MITGDEILNYIPQRTPIVMLDTFYGLENDDDNSNTALTVLESNVFVDAQTGCMADGGIVEHIAQSGAFHIGYLSVRDGNGVPLGFIGSVNKLAINRLPKVGEQMRTHICFEQRVGSITLIGAEVKVADEVIATCKMKVALV